jgi:hypothetical protein
MSDYFGQTSEPAVCRDRVRLSKKGRGRMPLDVSYTSVRRRRADSPNQEQPRAEVEAWLLALRRATFG